MGRRKKEGRKEGREGGRGKKTTPLEEEGEDGRSQQLAGQVIFLSLEEGAGIKEGKKEGKKDGRKDSNEGRMSRQATKVGEKRRRKKARE